MKKRCYRTPYFRIILTDSEDDILAVSPDIPFAGNDDYDPEKDPENIPEAE